MSQYGNAENDAVQPEREAWAVQSGHSEEVRKEALAQLKRKRDFRSILVAWVIVSAISTVTWLGTGAGYFWPIWPMLGIGLGVAAQAWGIWGPKDRGITDADIDAEIAKMQGRGK